MHDIPMIIRFCSGLRGALPTAFSFLKSKQLSYFLPTMNSDRLVWVDLEVRMHVRTCTYNVLFRDVEPRGRVEEEGTKGWR